MTRSSPVRARAQLRIGPPTDANGPGHSRLMQLRSDGPLVFRPTIANGAGQLPRSALTGRAPIYVARVAGAAAPVGGDDLRLQVEVEPGAALVLHDISATIALPGPHGERSHSHTTVHVGSNATLVWLAKPLIAARRCDHHAVTGIHLEPGARLLLREELLLGRHREEPGRVRQRLRVCIGDQPLHDQELALGPDVPGWQGSAVTGGRRALGSLLVVSTDLQTVKALPAVHAQDDLAWLPMRKEAALLTVLAEDAHSLRCLLDTGMSTLDEHVRTSGPPAEPHGHQTTGSDLLKGAEGDH